MICISSEKMRTLENGTDAESLTDLIQHNALLHTQYYHYTKVSRLDNILQNKEFWLLPVDRFNDEKDSETFGEGQKNTFSLCFSSGTTENLPLWYMYAGMDGKGARIGFRKKDFKKLAEELKLTLWEHTEGTDKKIIKADKYIRELRSGEDGCEIYFRDIMYIHDTERETRLKYNNAVKNNGVLKSEIEKFKANNPGCYKSLIWFYEKETRLIVKVPPSFIKKDKKYIVALQLDDTYNNMDIMLAPEYTPDEKAKVISQYLGFREFLSSKLKLSEYSGTINMSLCKNCDRKEKS